MKNRLSTHEINTLMTLLVLGGLAVSVVFVLQGVHDRANADAFNAPTSSVVQTTGSVKWVAGRTAPNILQVEFTTKEGRSVETKTWTAGRNRRYTQGQLVWLEYVAQYPESARLADGNAGKPKTLGMIVGGGAGIIVSTLLLVTVIRPQIWMRRNK